MSKELTKEQKCIVMRNSFEIWIDKEKAEQLQKDLETGKVNGFLRIENRTLNAVDISGIFSSIDIEDMHHKKQGDYQCKYSVWHKRGDICYCGQAPSPKEFYGS
jgi:hypothetical protein